MVLFFGPDDEAEPAREIRESQAKGVCAGCPLRLECLDEALQTQVRYGIWGGLNWDERLRERRRRARLASGRPVRGERLRRGGMPVPG